MNDTDFLDVIEIDTQKRVINQYSQREVMQKYINAGFAVVPLSGKIPTEKSWTDKTAKDSKPQERGNYGVVLSNTDLVLDIDPRNGGDKSFKKLLADIKFKELPSTYVVKTGGGGTHFYFKKPPAVPTKKILSDYPGIEFMSKGSQVVGPWSMHPASGKAYVIFSGSIDGITELPNEILALLRTEKKLVPLDSTNKIENIQARDRFISYLGTTAEVAHQGETGDLTTYKIAAKGKDYGLTQEQTYQLMLSHWNDKCSPPWSDEELQIKVANAYRYGVQQAAILSPQNAFPVIEEHDPDLFKSGAWKVDSKGQLIKNLLTNTVQHLITMPELQGLIRYNEFTQDIEFSRIAPWHHNGFNARWSDIDDYQLQHYLEQKYNYVSGDLQIIKAVNMVAHLNSFHPVKRWIESIKWDGVPRIHNWLSTYLGVKETEYTKDVGRISLAGAIHRIYSPGCKFDYMLILEGDTGIGKSTVIEILGQQWYSSGNIDFHNKDTVDLLRGKWIVEMAEMDNMNRQEVSAAKAFITRQVDRARLAFARRTKDYPRQCIFIGTINPNGYGYLKDDTGNRRYWPILCRAMDGKKTVRLAELTRDISQIWAEALEYCKKNPGDLYIKNYNVLKDAENEQEQRRPTDEWAGIIDTWAQTNGITEVQASKVWVEALGGDMIRFSRSEQMRLASVLKADLKWEQKKKGGGSTGAKTARVYIVSKTEEFLD